MSERRSAFEKLEEARKILASSTNNKYELGAALLLMHGGIEDRLRELIAVKNPSLSKNVYGSKEENIERVQWDTLRDYAQKNLGLTQNDSDFLKGAVPIRNRYAHGDGMDWNRDRLIEYEQLIRDIWQTGSRSGATLPPYKEPIKKPDSTTSFPQGYRNREPFFETTPPWYRRDGWLWFLFFFAFPIWVVLNLTDKELSVRVKALVLALGMLYGSVVYSLWNNLSTMPEIDLPALVAVTPVRSATRTPVASLTTRPVEQKQVDLPAVTNEGCQLVWSEYEKDNLAKKNRSMVWEEIVRQQVAGSGMKPAEFYGLVVEHNPVLETDGYEFKAGKTYFLPKCE